MSATPRHTLYLTGQHAVFILEDGTQLTATVRVSPRARRLRLVLTPEGTLRLTLPPGETANVEGVLRNMLPWLEKAWRRHCLRRPLPVLPGHIALPLLAANFAVRHAGTLAEGRRAASLAPRGRLTRALPLLSGAGPRRLLLLERESELLLYGDGEEVPCPWRRHCCGAGDDMRRMCCCLRSCWIWQRHWDLLWTRCSAGISVRSGEAAAASAP